MIQASLSPKQIADDKREPVLVIGHDVTNKTDKTVLIPIISSRNRPRKPEILKLAKKNFPALERLKDMHCWTDCKDRIEPVLKNRDN